MKFIIKNADIDTCTMAAGNYWGHCETYETQAAKHLDPLIPTRDSVPQKHKYPALERYRIARNAYYDLFNNGLGNRCRSFSKIFNIKVGNYKVDNFKFTSHMYILAEEAMDSIIYDALVEQGINPLADFDRNLVGYTSCYGWGCSRFDYNNPREGIVYFLKNSIEQKAA